jgi:hypothetical protein
VLIPSTGEPCAPSSQARLPPVLREYREVLVTDIKASIKVVVAEVLPIMWARPGNGEIIHEEGDGERGWSNLILAP